MAKVGRPPKDYIEKTGDAICLRIMDGETLRQVCRDPSLPSRSTVHKWASKNPEFADQYARAMIARSEDLFDELFDIADDATNDWMEVNSEENEGWRANGEAIQRSRLRVDTRKWALSKMQPKKYGERLELAGEVALIVQIGSDAEKL